MLHVETVYMMHLPSNTIVKDAALRDGPADENSYSPFDGEAKFLRSSFASLSVRRKFNMTEFLTEAAEYDPTRIGRNAETGSPNIDDEGEDLDIEYDDVADIDDTDYSMQNLEEQHKQFSGALHKHFVNLVNQYKTSSYSTYNQNNVFNVTRVVSRGEDGDETEADLLMEDEAVTITERAQERFPILLKRIHEKSRELRVSLLSLLAAYQDFVKYQGRSPMEMKARHFYDHHVLYHMNAAGYIDRPLDYVNDEKQAYMKEAKDFILGQYPKDPYYTNVCEFLNLCDELNINLSKEDITQFNTDLINRIRIKAVVSDAEFMQMDTGNPLFAYLNADSIFSTVHLEDSEEMNAESLNIGVYQIDDSTKLRDITIPRLHAIFKGNSEYCRKAQSSSFDTAVKFLKTFVYGREDATLPAYLGPNGLIIGPDKEPYYIKVSNLMEDDWVEPFMKIYFMNNGIAVVGLTAEKIIFFFTHEMLEVLKKVKAGEKTDGYTKYEV